MTDKRAYIVGAYIGTGLFLNAIASFANLLSGTAAHAAPQQPVRMGTERPMAVFLCDRYGKPLETLNNAPWNDHAWLAVTIDSPRYKP